jgi:hypothetical protein
MAVEMSLEGQGLKVLQRKLKAMDAKDLRRELNRGLKDAAGQMIPVARDAARGSLPQTGGLADRVASAPMRISVTTGRVRIMAKGMDRRSETGRLRHPVFGNREVWVTQQIKPHWFTERMRERAPQVRRELVEAMDRIARKVANA